MPVSVPVWSREESLSYVQERTGRDNLTEADAASADALCEALGDLPLAVAQLCGYMTARQTSIAEYQELFQTRRAALWQRESPPDAYHGTVATTWSLAFEQLPATAVALLRVCACLAPEPIPDGLFRAELDAEQLESWAAALQTALTDALAYHDARGALLNYSLVEISDDRLQVHRLVQTVVQDSLPDGAQSWHSAAMFLIRQTLHIDYDDPRTAYASEPLFLHALAVAEQAVQNESHLEDAGWVFNRLAIGAQCRGSLTHARELMQRAVAIDEKAYKPDHPTLAVGYWNLGRIEEDDGNIDQARALIERAHAIFLGRLGSEHSDTQNCAGWLAKNDAPS